MTQFYAVYRPHPRPCGMVPATGPRPSADHHGQADREQNGEQPSPRNCVSALRVATTPQVGR